MLRLSLSTLRERWQLFLGAIITVCIGVALVQSSLLLLVSAATQEIPAGLPELERAQLADAYEGGIALLGVTLGFSVFLAVFIVASTFAFNVAQRRRDLAMLRLVGGSRGHLRRLLLAEAAVLGLLGTSLGVPLGLLVMQTQSGLLTSLGLLPPEFEPRWQSWILGVSAGVGMLVALGGVWVASQRAAKIRALDALRESGEAARIMTVARWGFGLLFAGGAVAMAIVAGFVPSAGAMALSINATLAASVSLALFAPLVVPLVSRLLGFVLRGSTVAGLAEANLREGRRRTASTAAPLLVLVALLIAQFAAQASIAQASAAARSAKTDADLVVESAGLDDAGRLKGIAGVDLVSTQRPVPVTPRHVVIDDDDIEVEGGLTTAVAVDAAYAKTHLQEPESGSLANLRGNTVALGPEYDADQDLEVGDTFTMTIGGTSRVLRVVAIMPPTLGAPVEYLIPASLAADVPAPAVSFVQVASGADTAVVAERVRAAGLGRVQTASAWLAASAEAQQEQQRSISLVVLGLGGLYALIAVINAVVISAADRRREFAVARVSGLSRGQVVRAALIESTAVTAIGLLLGGLASMATIFGIAGSTANLIGTTHVVVPFGVLGVAVLGALGVVGATSLWTAISATRPRPVGLIGARE